jgi:Protein of unknown function (DUF2971)
MESWVDGYFESLTSVDAATGRGEALALKLANFPKALYRYRSLESLASSLAELGDGFVFLSNPTHFSDPYDSVLSTSLEQLEKGIFEKLGLEYDPGTEAKYFESLGEKEKIEWRAQEEFKQIAFQNLLGGLWSLLYPNASLDGRDFFSSFRSLVRVSCFTTNPNSVVMWSHYANQHRGICIEFLGSSMVSSATFLEQIHPVRYAENLFDLSQILSLLTPGIDHNEGEELSAPNSNPNSWPILAACHKSREWAYENEWRLVSLDPGNQRAPKFSLNACDIEPSRIILGAKIAHDDEAAIKELAQKISVPVINAQLAKDRFKIEF